MWQKTPVVAMPIPVAELARASGFFSGGGKRLKEFEASLGNALGVKYCLAAGSGKTSLYLILKSLAKLSGKNEVILPAYTDAGLVLVIQKAGLKPVLCDISAQTFNLDADVLPGVISENTLAVLAVHMFGLACEINLISEIARAKDIFLIEDCAQALGTSINGRMAGTMGDIGFYSFNRGKNLPTYSGGCIVTNSEELQGATIKERELLKEPGVFPKLALLFKLIGLSLATKPGVYSLFYPFIAPFKNNSIPEDFNTVKYTDFQSSVAIALLKKLSEFSEKRQENALFLMEGLKDISGIVLPRIIPGSNPAFNRLPVVFKDISLREKAQARLLKDGIESSCMYPYTLHQVFDLGYKTEDFPNAVYLSKHLLTIPVHPLVKREILLRIIEIIKSI